MRAALLIALLVASVGCGVGQSAPGATSETQLSISYWPEGRSAKTPQRSTLRCDPAGGTIARAPAVCRRLYGISKPFAPLRKDIVCTDQYGGPQQAIIAGTYRGNRIWTLIGMRNGCEISRAKRLAFLIPGFAGAAADS
jgi:hypothetical protein